MAYVWTGNSRARRVTIRKFVNGTQTLVQTFPSDADMIAGEFSWGTPPDDVTQAIPDDEEFAQLTPEQYDIYYFNLIAYIQASVSGFVYSAVPPGNIDPPHFIIGDDDCHEPGTPVDPTTTTTTPAPTTTTTTEAPTTTTTTVETGTCWSLWIPTASLVDGEEEEFLNKTTRSPL